MRDTLSVDAAATNTTPVDSKNFQVTAELVPSDQTITSDRAMPSMMQTMQIPKQILFSPERSMTDRLIESVRVPISCHTGGQPTLV